MAFKIFAINGGFYYFGDEVQGPDGFLALNDAAMFGGFGGGKGVAGVARADKAATVTLDRFEKGQEVLFPLTAVFAVMPAKNLYTFPGATLR